jgi:methionyl-tRNA synthetase
MSKTAGTAVNLDDAIARHGPDALRYFLLREVGFESDGDFTWDRFDARYTSDLADGLGNLVSRSLAMVDKFRGGVVPPAGAATTLDAAGAAAVEAYATALDRLDLKGAAEAAWSLVTTANQFIVQTAPWSLAKQANEPELDRVLHSLSGCLYRLAMLASPYLPGKAAEIWQALGQSGAPGAAAWGRLASPNLAGTTTTIPGVLFPKIPTGK